MSLEKGPLARFHLQIVPYNHVESTGRLEQVEVEEMDKLTTRLEDYFRGQGLSVIVYERSINLASVINHCVRHLIPVRMK